MTLQIFMPFYGRFDHFREAVESVLAQTDPEWELAIVDDQYPDVAPGEWAAALRDPRVTYRRNEMNIGVAGSFREAAMTANGSHAVIMGCDDIMLPRYVEHVRELTARYPDVAIIQPGVRVIDDRGDQVMPLPDRVKALSRPGGAKTQVFRGERLAKTLLRGNWTYFPSICWRVDYLKRFPFRTDLDVVLDLALQLEIVRDGGTMLVDNEKIFAYRRHAGSVSSWTALDGTRFLQEASLFRENAELMDALMWKSAARSARLHLTSRLNAATKLPGAVRMGKRATRRLLLAHVFGH